MLGGKSNGELGRIGKGEMGCWAGPGEERWRSGQGWGERLGQIRGPGVLQGTGRAGEERLGAGRGAGRSDGELGRD